MKAAPHPFGNLAIHRDSGCLKSWSSLHLQIFVNARCLKDRILVKKILNIQYKRTLNCTQGPSKTAKNSCFGQNAKIVPSEADFIAEYHCGGYFLLKCLTSMIFRIFCGSFSRHFLLARNSPGRPGRNDILPGLPENLKFSLKFEILRQARQNIISAWPAWRVSSQ